MKSSIFIIIWLVSINLWRHVFRNMKNIFNILKVPKIFYGDIITEVSTRFWISWITSHARVEQNLQISTIWSLFIHLWRHVWRNLLDCFDILNIPEISHHYIIPMTSSLIYLWVCTTLLKVLFSQYWLKRAIKCKKIVFFQDVEYFILRSGQGM